MSLLDEYSKAPEQYYCVLYLDEDPVVAAKSYSSHHLQKLVPHAARVLSTVWIKLGGNVVYFDWGQPIDTHPFGELKYLNTVLFGTQIYHPMHVTHPLVEWAALYGGNYDWLWRHAMTLVEEMEKRFGKIHCCLEALRALEFTPPPLLPTFSTWCDLPVVLPSQYSGVDAVAAYRDYYRKGGAGLLSFKGSVEPNWLT